MRSFSGNKKMRAALALAALMALCNDTMPNGTRGVEAQQVELAEADFGLVGSRNQLNFVPGGQLAGEPAGPLAGRFRRQVAYPPGSPLAGNGPQQQLQQASPQPSGGTNVFSFLSELGPQVAQAKSISSLFSSQPQQQGQQQQQSAASTAAQALNAAALMGQLSELVRSTQERQARNIEGGQQAVQQAGQQAQQMGANAAQNAQGGIQAALSDIGTGLQRIAANNPNLLPDVKSLYQSVSSKLSSASSSVAAAAQPNGPQSGQAQFAQNLANQVANPQPV